MFELTGKQALVTGATGYLGEHLARALGEAGATVYVNSRSQGRCGLSVEKLCAEGLDARPAVFDVTKVESIRRFFREFSGALHVLVNNAYSGASGSIAYSNEEHYQASYNVTVTAAHNMVSCSLNTLQVAVAECGDASVINIASMYGLVTPDPSMYESEQQQNPPFYGAAKAALIHWGRYAAREFAPMGIRINSLSPGPFPNADVQDSAPVFVDKLIRKVPLGRIGYPNDLAGPLLLLASESSRFMTGANLVVDGGWTSV